MKMIIAMFFLAFFTASCNLSTANRVKKPVTLHIVLQERMSSVKSVEFSLDGKYFLARGGSRPIFVWKVKDQKLYKEIKITDELFDTIRSKISPRSFVNANFTPDSRSIFAGLDNGTAVMIPLDSGEIIVYSFGDEERNAKHSVMSRSGKILAMDGSYLNTANNQLTHILGMQDSGLVISNDDKYLVTSSYHISTVKISDITTGKEMQWYPASFFIISQKVHDIDISPDNDTIAAGLSNGDVRLYSIRQNKEIGNLPQGGWSVKARFSPDGKMLASSSDNNKVKLWDVASQSRISTWKTDDGPNMIKWLRETHWLAIGTDSGELIIASTEKDETMFKDRVMEAEILDMDYLPAERLLLLCDKEGNISAFKIL